MKKILCVLLSVLCFASCFSVISFAECEHAYLPTTVAATCAEKGYTLYVCSKCGDNYKSDYTEALGHAYGAWQDVDDATCTTEGHKIKKCIRCDAVIEEMIPVLEHKDADRDGRCDVCDTEVEVIKVFSPFDWLVSFFKAVIEWFREIFA